MSIIEDEKVEIATETSKANQEPNAPVSVGKQHLLYILVPVAILVALAFDRLVIAGIFDREYGEFMMRYGGFWLGFFVLFCVLYRKKIVAKKALWFSGICCVALGLWYFFFVKDYENVEYAFLTFLILPALLMAFAQFTAGDYNLKETEKIFLAWLSGWLVKPLSGIPAFFEAVSNLAWGKDKKALSKVFLALAFTVPLIIVLVVLLSQADMVFKYYLEDLLGNWDITNFVKHAIFVAILSLLLFSVLWNVGFGKTIETTITPQIKIDQIFSTVLLSAVVILYAMFCSIQFTYLFARAGLPADLSYAQYAREGFSQTVTVCIINLLLYGFFLQYGTKDKITKVLLLALMAATGVMLISGGLRLSLYIEAYGLTFMRLLPAWFIVYLAVVIVISIGRMFKEKLPAIALAFFVLLAWYVALGYSNPEKLISEYNRANNYDQPTKK